jgi:hypothetical protein
MTRKSFVLSIVVFALIYAMVHFGPSSMTGRFNAFCYERSATPVAQFADLEACMAGTYAVEAWRYCACSAEESRFARLYYWLLPPIGLIASISVLRFVFRREPRDQMRFLRPILAFLWAPLAAPGAYGLLILSHPFGYGWQHTLSFLLFLGAVAYAAEVLFVLPVFIGLRRRPAVVTGAVPVAGLFGAALVTAVIGFPSMWFGPSSIRFSELGLVVSFLLVFISVGITRWALWPLSAAEFSARRRTTVVAAVFITWSVAGIVRPQLTLLWGTPAPIEQYLLHETPLGSSREDVQNWLRAPRADSPVPTLPQGGRTLHTSIFHYSLVFETAVEVFYTFDAQGRLVDLRVRKTTDAL